MYSICYMCIVTDCMESVKRNHDFDVHMFFSAFYSRSSLPSADRFTAIRSIVQAISAALPFSFSQASGSWYTRNSAPKITSYSLLAPSGSPVASEISSKRYRAAFRELVFFHLIPRIFIDICPESVLSPHPALKNAVPFSSRRGNKNRNTAGFLSYL